MSLQVLMQVIGANISLDHLCMVNQILNFNKRRHETCPE